MLAASQAHFTVPSFYNRCRQRQRGLDVINKSTRRPNNHATIALQVSGIPVSRRVQIG